MTVVETRVVLYLEVRCPCCGSRLFDVPGKPDLDLRIVDHGASGTGPVIRCKRCSSDIEVVQT
jgi:DNA-directed RNA polymerase subunit RPC12/RpoP